MYTISRHYVGCTDPRRYPYDEDGEVKTYPTIEGATAEARRQAALVSPDDFLLPTGSHIDPNGPYIAVISWEIRDGTGASVRGAAEASVIFRMAEDQEGAQ